MQLVDKSSVTKIEKGNDSRIDDKLVDVVSERFLVSPDRDCQLTTPTLIIDTLDETKKRIGIAMRMSMITPSAKLLDLN